MAERTLDGGRLASALRLLVLVLALLAGATAAFAETQKPLKGVALIVGNGDYQHIAKLANPRNDARAIEELLDSLGFETTMVSDRNAKRLKRDLETFADDAAEADVAIVYYSGHGIEAGGENYLVPTDADLSALGDAGDKLVPLSQLTAQLKATVPVTIVMLDACRSDPFPQGALVKATPDAKGAPIGAGLGEARGAVALSATAKPEENLGTVIGFAAEPGHIALDGKAGGNSPYTAAILRHLSAIDGQEFGTVMRMVAEEVYLKTAGRQRPWVNESLRRLIYFGAAPAATQGAEGDILAERRSLLLTIAALPQAGRGRIEAIARTDGVPMDALYGMLAALGTQAPTDPTELDALLRGQTARLKTMLAERDALKSTDPEIGKLSALANQALDEGALTTAIKLLGDAKARVATLDKAVDNAEADIRNRRIEFAAVYARSAEAHALAFDYLAAANDFASAFEQVERWDDRLAWTYKNGETETLTTHGLYKGDKQALSRAIAAGKTAARLAEGFDDKAGWEDSQLLFGNALQALGERDSGTENLDASVQAYRALLDAVTPARQPLVWAKAQNNLANTLATLGRRQGDKATLEQAVAAYRETIGFFERNNAPAEWAAAQSNLGKALMEIADIEPGVERLNAAGAAFESALSQTPRAGAPMRWALVWNNLGNVYQNLGLRTADPNISAGRHMQAVAAFGKALSEWTRERAPAQWGVAQSNLANAYQSLSSHEKDPAIAIRYLNDAEAAQRAALAAVTRDSSPLQWGTLTFNLGRTLHALGDQAETPADKARYYAGAAACYRDALGELTRERVPLQWAALQASLGHVLQALAEQETDEARALAGLAEAEKAQRAAMEVLTAERAPQDRANVQHALGMTLMMLGGKQSDPARFEQAAAIYRDELALRSRETGPVDWAKAQAGVGNALRALGMYTNDKATLTEAKARTQEAWDVIRPLDPQYDEVLGKRIKTIESVLSGLN